MDYAVFLHEKESYYLRASGVFFDAINYNKPIISIKNSYFEYYFNKYGNIGYLCNDINEMFNIMKLILTNKEKANYMQQTKNINFLKNDLSIKKIAKKICYIYMKEGI